MSLDVLIQSILPLIFVVGISYLFIIKPERKAKQEFMALQNSLAVNDEVVTKGGLIAKIIKIEDNVATIEIAEKTRVKIMKDAIVKRMN